MNMSAKQGSVIGRSWTDLSSIKPKPPPSRNELLATLVDQLIDLFLSYPEKVFPIGEIRGMPEIHLWVKMLK